MRFLLDGLILIVVLGVLNYINALIHTQTKKNTQQRQKHFLSKAELKIAKDNDFPLEILKRIKYKTSGTVEEVRASSDFSLEPDKTIPGIQLCFSHKARMITGEEDIAPELQKIAEQCSTYPELKGYVVSVCQLSPFSSEHRYALVFIKSENHLDLLQVLCPSPDGSIEYMNEYTALYKKWYEKKPFKILFMAPDTLHFRFLTSLTKAESQTLAEIIYKYSPDTVDMRYDTEEGSTLALQQYALSLEYSGFVELYWD